MRNEEKINSEKDGKKGKENSEEEVGQKNCETGRRGKR
jgi:hypothetical protein